MEAVLTPAVIRAPEAPVNHQSKTDISHSRVWHVRHDGHCIGLVCDVGYGFASMDLDFKPIDVFDTLHEAVLNIWSWRT